VNPGAGARHTTGCGYLAASGNRSYGNQHLTISNWCPCSV